MRGVAPLLGNPWRRGRILLGLRVGLLLGCLPLLVLATDLALHPSTRSHPQSSSLEGVPNGALLVALGLSTQPATRPTGDRVRVERLLYDGQATYLLYRAAANVDLGQPWRPVLPGPPYLYDQRGRRYAPTDSTESSGWPDDEGLAWYPQLAPDARTITLNLGGQGAVRLTIPTPLPVWRVTRPLIRRAVHGITLTLTRLANSAAGTYVTYTLDRPGRLPMFFYQGGLVTRGGG